MAWLKKTSVTCVERSWAETPLSATALWDSTRASVNCSAASFILCWLCWSVIKLVTILSVAPLEQTLYLPSRIYLVSWNFLASDFAFQSARTALPHAFFCRLPLPLGEDGLLPLAHSYGASTLLDSPSHTRRLTHLPSILTSAPHVRYGG